MKTPSEVIAELQGQLELERASYQAAIAKTVKEYAASIEWLQAQVQKYDALVSELAPAAEKWNAIASCYRITCMGSAGLLKPVERDYAHATFNLWTIAGEPPAGCSDGQDQHGREVLADFMKVAVNNYRLSLEQVVVASEAYPDLENSAAAERPANRGTVRPSTGRGDSYPLVSTTHNQESVK